MTHKGIGSAAIMGPFAAFLPDKKQKQKTVTQGGPATASPLAGAAKPAGTGAKGGFFGAQSFGGDNASFLSGGATQSRSTFLGGG